MIWKKRKSKSLKKELEQLLTKYDAAITTSRAFCLMDYPAVSFCVGGKEYWSIDNDGYAASTITSSDVKEIILR